jgi:hypothetical protein
MKTSQRFWRGLFLLITVCAAACLPDAPRHLHPWQQSPFSVVVPRLGGAKNGEWIVHNPTSHQSYNWGSWFDNGGS